MSKFDMDEIVRHNTSSWQENDLAKQMLELMKEVTNLKSEIEKLKSLKVGYELVNEHELIDK